MHRDEYRARTNGLQPSSGLTPGEPRRQDRQLKAAKDCDITLQQRLAYLTSEVAKEGGRRPWNVLDRSEWADVDLDNAFAKKTSQSSGREW